jgi:DnaJ-class molecular chaperone
MDFKDYYATLGVAKTATEKEIKQAFRKLARKHHPDVNPGDKGAEGRFKELNEAYEVLGDPDKRKKYDELGANWRMYEQAGAAGAPGAGPGAGAWNVPFGAGGAPGGGFRTMTEEEMREMFGDADPFSDFFHTFFGGSMGQEDRGGRARGARTRTARQGRNVEQEIELGLEDAYHGATRRLAITHGGEARTVDVRIPPGVTDGSRVRIAGEGEHGAGGAKSGDLYLRIRLAPHPKFERKGRDLYTRVSVPLTTAVLGGEADAHAQRQTAASEDSAGDPEWPGAPDQRARDAGGREAGRNRRLVRDHQRGASPRPDAGAARVVRVAEEAGRRHETLGRLRNKPRRHEDHQDHETIKIFFVSFVSSR